MPLSCLTNREIGRIIGTSEEVMKIQLRGAFDKLGVWSRLELAMYLASNGGKSWKAKPGVPAIGFPSGGGGRAGGFSARRLFMAQTLETKPMSQKNPVRVGLTRISFSPCLYHSEAESRLFGNESAAARARLRANCCKRFHERLDAG